MVQLDARAHLGSGRQVVKSCMSMSIVMRKRDGMECSRV
jgi:hypothetical protein